MPSWAWLIAAFVIGVYVGAFAMGWLCSDSFSALETKEREARQENRRLNGLLREITDTKEGV